MSMNYPYRLFRLVAFFTRRGCQKKVPNATCSCPLVETNNSILQYIFTVQLYQVSKEVLLSIFIFLPEPLCQRACQAPAQHQCIQSDNMFCMELSAIFTPLLLFFFCSTKSSFHPPTLLLCHKPVEGNVTAFHLLLSGVE